MNVLWVRAGTMHLAAALTPYATNQPNNIPTEPAYAWHMLHAAQLPAQNCSPLIGTAAPCCCVQVVRMDVAAAMSLQHVLSTSPLRSTAPTLDTMTVSLTSFETPASLHRLWPLPHHKCLCTFAHLQATPCRSAFGSILTEFRQVAAVCLLCPRTAARGALLRFL